jgi:hypothetical protein
MPRQEEQPIEQDELENLLSGAVISFEGEETEDDDDEFDDEFDDDEED